MFATFNNGYELDQWTIPEDHGGGIAQKRIRLPAERNMRSHILLLACAIITAFGLNLAVLAQDITATLTGTVSDSTGAAISGAKVVVHDNGTGTDRTVTTNGIGVYTVPQMLVGTYTISVTQTGFGKFVASQVIMHVGEQRALNITLKPATAAEEVVVTATTTPVETESSSQQQTITGKQILELQLNNRNFESLVVLQPGVSSSLPDEVGFGISGFNDIAVNGARTHSNNWMLDGADDNDAGGNQTINVVPSIDALEEFTVARSNYDAQYGRNGGGQINVVTKGGTNQFHGDAYEFDRNSIFNANSWLNNQQGIPNPPYRYNDFGFTVGGPIFKNKTFFFVSEEWRITKTPTTFQALIPNPQVLQGNFTGLYTGTYPNEVPVGLDPTAGPPGCIAGNQISPNCFSSNTQAYINNIFTRFPPSPSICAYPDGNPMMNCWPYTTSISDKNNNREDMVRLDQVISSKFRLFGRFLQEQNPATEAGGQWTGNPLPGISSTATNAPGRNIVFHATQDISQTMFNETGFNYSWGSIAITGTGVMANASAFTGLSWNGFPYGPDIYNRIPSVGIRHTNIADQINSPYHEHNVDKNFYDNFAWSKGKHTVRTGVTFQGMVKSENDAGVLTNGYFAFPIGGRHTPDNPPLANFLLGEATYLEQQSRDIIPNLHYLNFEAYVQDDWKLSRRLTLNLGLRYSFFPVPHNDNAVLENFDPQVFNPQAVPAIDEWGDMPIIPDTYTNGIIAALGGQGSLFGATVSPYGNSLNPNYNNNWAPRIGFSWDPFGNGKMAVRGGYGIFYERGLNAIWEQNTFLDPPFMQTAFMWNSQIPGTNQWYDTFDNPSAVPAAGASTLPIGINATGNPDFKVPYYQSWNLSIQREVLPNTLLEVAYVGGKGTHLLGTDDINQPTVQARLATDIGSGNGVPPAYGTEVSLLRPYVGWGSIKSIVSDFDSNYNSLQISVNRRVAKGLTISAAYTWSKTLTDNSYDRGQAPQDPYNLRAEYGPAAFDFPQVLVVNYVYELPFFRAQRGLIGHVLGGWEISGISRFQTGYPLTITQDNDPFNVWDWPQATQAQINNMGNDGLGLDLPNSPSMRRALQISNNVKGPKTPQEWFNTAAFTDAIGQFGNSRNGVVLGPGLNNWDMSVMKNDRINERFSMQFRTEFFNAFNHASFSAVGTDVDASGFGVVQGVHDPRIIQLGLKLMF